ncbi:MAG: hypothetical protein Q4D16_17605 [Eubacteriales bacterium]|nr:hypothetical protein [Eubacteriales bacterium]
MRSFRKIVISLVILLAFVFGLNSVSRYMYESVRNNIVFAREELEENKGTIDTLLLGTSLVHWGLDPEVIDEELGVKSFNLATSAQPLSGSYYLLKDQVKSNPIKTVFLGVSVPGMVNDYDKDTPVKLGVFDRISSPAVKAEYMAAVAEFKEYEQFLFFPTRVVNVLDTKAVKRNVAYKKSEEFKEKISPDYAPYIYYGMGFESKEEVYDGSFNDEKLGNDAIWNRDRIVDVNVEYIKKTAQFCNDNGIELNLVIFPHSYEFARLQGDLSDMDKYMEELSAEIGAELYNYNFTVRQDIYDIMTNDCYQDKKHFNKKGAGRFAELLCSDYKETSLK